MKSKNHLTIVAFLVQLGVCGATVLAVKRLDYNYSNILFPFLLRLQAAFVGALRPVIGDSMGLTTVILASVSVSVLAVVCALFWRSGKKPLRLVGYILSILLVLVDVLWFSTSTLKRCC
jgi:hypothetical protein